MRALTVGDETFASMPDLAEVSDVPAHVRIEQWLAGEMKVGHLDVGDKLPPEGAVAAALGVSRMTLRQALGALEGRGLVQRKRGRAGGTFVSRPRIECDLTGLPGFTEQMRRVHVRAGARIVRSGVVTAPPAMQYLPQRSHLGKGAGPEGRCSCFVRVSQRPGGVAWWTRPTWPRASVASTRSRL